MKKFFALAFGILSLAMVLTSCEEKKYKSGEYVYTYYLVNESSTTITYRHTNGKDVETTVLAPSDSMVYAIHGRQYEASEVEELKRPSLEDGYVGSIDHPATQELIVNEQTFTITSDMENSFIQCANYKGEQDANSPFKYNYTFSLTDSYLSSLAK